MSAEQLTGLPLHAFQPKKASTVFALSSFVEFSSGVLQPATAVTESIYGICDKAIAATDGDYALNTQIPVALPDDKSTFLVDVFGDIDDVVIGERRDLHDAVSIDATAKTIGPVTVVGKLNGKAEVMINSFVGYKNSDES